MASTVPMLVKHNNKKPVATVIWQAPETLPCMHGDIDAQPAGRSGKPMPEGRSTDERLCTSHRDGGRHHGLNACQQVSAMH